MLSIFSLFIWMVFITLKLDFANRSMVPNQVQRIDIFCVLSGTRKYSKSMAIENL